VSRLPRAQEFLKTGFNAEAASAARLRAAAARAESDGRPNLARALRELAAEKDALALAQLEAAGQVHGAEADLAAALAEERYENDALYPKMWREVDEETAGVFRDVVVRQRAHAERLAGLLDAVTRSSGDLPA
jgi:rubrerythrin